MWMQRWFCLICLTACAMVAQAAPLRVVSLGGSVTEIIYALEQGHRLVAADQSSLYPEAATHLPRVGYYRAVPLEGVLSMHPDLVLASEHAQPHSALQRMQDLGVTVQRVSDAASLTSLYTRIAEVARALGVPARGDALVARIKQEIGAAQAAAGQSRSVLVLVNRSGQFMAAGAGTNADQNLTLAGLHNVLSTQKGYKPVSAEGVVALAPDLIVVTRTSLENEDLAAFLARPGIAATPAARDRRVLVMDDLLMLGLGPRTADTIRQLKAASLQ